MPEIRQYTFSNKELLELLLKQADASKGLKRAEPALVRAMAALESLDRRDLGNCKTMNKGESKTAHLSSTIS